VRRRARRAEVFPRGRLFDTGAERRTAFAAWTVAFVISVVLIAAVGFTSRDPDSTVYAGISARLSELPVRQWVAPQWWGLWGFEGPFREHPIGYFIPPALAARAGYPAEQAAYAVHGLYQILSLVLIAALASSVVRQPEARALAWVLQLLPIAFVFRIRANQEYAVLAAILLALYATERSRRHAGWTIVTAAAFAWALLVKGVFGLLVPVACAAWLLCRDASEGVRWRPAPWVALAAVLLVAPALAWGYEQWYRGVTGDSFLAFYTGPRLDPEAVAAATPTRVVSNTIWYTGRLVWYAFPWSALAMIAGLAMVTSRWRRPSRGRPDIGGPSLVRSAHAPAAARGETEARDLGGLVFVFVTAALVIVAMAFSDRRADRFIFPAYFLAAAAGAAVAARWSPAFGRVVATLDRPWVPAAVWLALFLLRLATGAHLPRPAISG
jgi:4-amino-4-deoxy-L-arabinose transferase-like glycosyltransferase